MKTSLGSPPVSSRPGELIPVDLPRPSGRLHEASFPAIIRPRSGFTVHLPATLEVRPRPSPPRPRSIVAINPLIHALASRPESGTGPAQRAPSRTLSPPRQRPRRPPSFPQTPINPARSYQKRPLPCPVSSVPNPPSLPVTITAPIAIAGAPSARRSAPASRP